MGQGAIEANKPRRGGAREYVVLVAFATALFGGSTAGMLAFGMSCDFFVNGEPVGVLCKYPGVRLGVTLAFYLGVALVLARGASTIARRVSAWCAAPILGVAWLAYTWANTHPDTTVGWYGAGYWAGGWAISLVSVLLFSRRRGGIAVSGAR